MQKITLDSATEAVLQSWSRGRSVEHRFVVRARIILGFVAQKSHRQIAKELGISSSTVNVWRGRFIKNGIEGLKDKSRQGAPRTYSEQDRIRVIQMACEKPRDGYTRWTYERIAKECNMSKATVGRILKEAEIKPHKVEYWCGKSTDPEFELKMLDIVGLYLSKDEKALVLCVDEKTQIQAIDRTQPVLPVAPGHSQRQTATYKRNGTVSLIAALAVHQGEITSSVIDKNNAENFLKFLRKLDRKYRNVTIHIVMDNLAVHKQKDVKKWFATKRKFVAHYTPTYSSWLNQVEIFFGILTRDVVKDGVWPSRQALVRQLVEYIQTYNRERAAPFNWTFDGTKSAAEI